MEASAPQLEPEPREWRLRNLTVASRLWCGGTSFFFAAFIFAYFYLHALNSAHAWRVGPVNPSGGLGVAIMGVFVLSALLLYMGGRRPQDSFSTGVVALILLLLGVALQFFEYSTLGFGPASGGYASVFFGWTATYAAGALGVGYWIETQMATIWRAQQEGWKNDVDEGVAQAGLRAASIYWSYYAALGVIMYVVLYLI